MYRDRVHWVGPSNSDTLNLLRGELRFMGWPATRYAYLMLAYCTPKAWSLGFEGLPRRKTSLQYKRSTFQYQP
jgi:hypothetical protein